VTARADLADRLMLSTTTPTKTFVLDVHTTDPDLYLEDLVGRSNVEATSDAALWGVHLPEGDFWVDQLDPRFWSFHTDMPVHDARRYLRERVEERRDLDWVWLPSEHLRQVAPGTCARRVRTSFSGRGLLGSDARTNRLKPGGVRLSRRRGPRLSRQQRRVPVRGQPGGNPRCYRRPRQRSAQRGRYSHEKNCRLR